jgi:hypothetical protein
VDLGNDDAACQAMAADAAHPAPWSCPGLVDTL